MRVQGLDFNIYVDVLDPNLLTSLRAFMTQAMSAFLAEKATILLKKRYHFR